MHELCQASRTFLRFKKPELMHLILKQNIIIYLAKATSANGNIPSIEIDLVRNF